MNRYREMKERHQKEVNDFPMFFAFSREQFDRGMRSLGLEPTDTGKIYKFGETGGFYRREDSKRLAEMLDRHTREMDDAIKADTTGDGFIFDMFIYELANHEYTITYEYEDTFQALGLTREEIYGNNALAAGLKKATRKYLEGCE